MAAPVAIVLPWRADVSQLVSQLSVGMRALMLSVLTVNKCETDGMVRMDAREMGNDLLWQMALQTLTPAATGGDDFLGELDDLIRFTIAYCDSHSHCVSEAMRTMAPVSLSALRQLVRSRKPIDEWWCQAQARAKQTLETRDPVKCEATIRYLANALNHSFLTIVMMHTRYRNIFSFDYPSRPFRAEAVWARLDEAYLMPMARDTQWYKDADDWLYDLLVVSSSRAHEHASSARWQRPLCGGTGGVAGRRMQQ